MPSLWYVQLSRSSGAQPQNNTDIQLRCKTARATPVRLVFAVGLSQKPAARNTSRTAVIINICILEHKVSCKVIYLCTELSESDNYIKTLRWERYRYDLKGGAKVSDTTHLRSAQPSVEEQTPHWSCQRGLAQPLHRRCVSDILTLGAPNCNMVIWLWNCRCKQVYLANWWDKYKICTFESPVMHLHTYASGAAHRREKLLKMTFLIASPVSFTELQLGIKPC